MKYAIISDLHSNLEALTAVLDVIDQAQVDKIVCLGDVVGYNASPNECVDIIRERDIPTICGNHDAVACEIEQPYGFNQVATEAAMWTRDALREDNVDWLRNLPDAQRFNSFLAVHGAPANRDTYLFAWSDILPHVPYVEQQGCSLCLFGHTHCPGIFATDGRYTVDDDQKFALGEGKIFFINPGSVGQPRDGDPRASFGFLDTDEGEFELVRIEYDVDAAAERVLNAGLPDFLARRIKVGR